MKRLQFLLAILLTIACGRPAHEHSEDVLPPLSAYTPVRSLDALPSLWRESFLEVFATRERKSPGLAFRAASPALLIAPRAGPYQATDILEPTLPQRQFLLAGLGPQPVLFYFHGGIGKHTHALFLERSRGRIRISRNVFVPLSWEDAPATLAPFWAALQSAPLMHARGDV